LRRESEEEISELPTGRCARLAKDFHIHDKETREIKMSIKASSNRSSVKITLSEKLDLVFVILSLPVTVLHAVLTGLWRSQKNAKTFFLHVAYAVFRRLTRRLSPLQLQ
jgi:uncharacterized ion transporter superfamily protein YfcC